MSQFLNPFRLIFYILNISLVMIFVLLIFSSKGIIQNDKLETMVLKSEVKYNKIFQEYSDLKKNIELFKTNSYYQKMILHKEIGYIDENERIYIFENE